MPAVGASDERGGSSGTSVAPAAGGMVHKDLNSMVVNSFESISQPYSSIYNGQFIV